MVLLMAFAMVFGSFSAMNAEVARAAGENVVPIGFSTDNGSIDSVTITDGSNNAVDGASYSKSGTTDITVNVTLPHDYTPAGTMKAVFSRTPNSDDFPYVTPYDNKWAGTTRTQTYGGRTDTYSTTLSGGAGTATAYIYEGNSRATGSKKGSVVVKYGIANELPKRKDGVSASTTAEMIAGETFKLDLSTIFEDADGDALTYKVKVGSAAAASAAENYEFTTDQMGEYVLVFTANDGIQDSTQTYTVNLTVARKEGTWYITNTSGTGYSTTAAEGSSSPVNNGENYTVKLNLGADYECGDSFVIKANGVALEEDSEGSNTFTIKNITEDQTITVEGVELKKAKVTAPAGSVVKAGYEQGEWTYYWYDPVKIINNNDGTATYHFSPITSGKPFYRVQNPQGVTYWNFESMSAGKEYTVTMDDLTKNGTFASGTIYHDFHYNYLDLGDIYLTVNDRNYLPLAQGGTKTLNAFRNWNPINSFTNDMIAVPDFHYEVVDINGNPSDLVTVTPDANNSGRSTIEASNSGTGLAIIKVTYDALIHMDGYASGYGAGGADTTRFGATWPECTGIIVVSVGEDGSAIDMGMTINTEAPLKHAGKSAGDKIDAEHDLLYYYGDEGASYTFRPEEGAKVSVARCMVGDRDLGFNGFTTDGVKVDDEGNVTVSGLTSGRHIVKVEKDGVANYQVLSARHITIEVKDKDENIIEDWETRVFAPGDTLSLKLHNVNSPQEKLAQCYNNSFSIAYYDENDKKMAAQNDGDHGYGQYNFSSMDQVVTVAVPEDWTVKHTYELRGAVAMAGFSGTAAGGHRAKNYGGESGMAQGTSGAGVLGALPDLKFNVNVKPYIKDGLEKTVLATVDAGNDYQLDLSEIFTDPNGDDLTYKVSVNDAEPKAADEQYSFPVEEAGAYKLVFQANDGIEDSDDLYTVVVKAGVENIKPMRKATVAESADVQIGRKDKYNLDLSTIFEDAEGDALTYKVTIGDKDPVDADEQYEYEPEGPGNTTLVFKANDGKDDSDDTYTVKLTVLDGVDPYEYWNSSTDGNGWVGGSATYCYVDGVSSSGVFVKDAKWTGNTCDITLVPETAANKKFEFSVSKYTRATGQGVYIDGTQYGGASRTITTNTVKFALDHGQKAVTVQPYNGSTLGTLKTFNFRIANDPPVAAETEIKSRVKKDQTFKLDLSTLFTDPEGDELTYKVSVNGEDAVSADADYQFDTAGMGEGDTAKLVFQANDGMSDSGKVTVNLRVGGSVKVDFTSQMSGGFLHAPQTGKEVSEFLAEDYGYSDEVDGVSALDVLVAAHELTFGDAFTAETAEDYLKIKNNNVERQFGVDPVEGFMGDTFRGGFYLNHAYPNDGTEYDNGYDWVEYNGTVVGTQEVKNGDFVEFFFYENEYAADTYTWFTDEESKYSRSFKQCAGEDLTLILKGFYAAEGRRCKDEEELVNYDGANELADQQLYLVDMETGAKTEIDDAVTDEDGEVTLKFDQPGKYVITAYGEDDYGMMTPIMTLTTITVVEHDWDEGTYTTVPTATEPGEKLYKCKNDPSHTKTETVPAYGEETIKINLLTQIKKNTLAGVYDDFTVSSEDAGKYGYEKPEAFWGKVTVADAAAAVHYEMYGEDFAQNPEGYLKINSAGTATKIFGEESMTIGFKVNDVSPEYPDDPGTGSVWNDTPLKNNDKVRIFMPRGDYYGLMDSYLMFDADKYDEHVGGSIKVTVTGDYAFGTMMGMPADIQPAEDAVVVLCKDYTDPEGTKVDEAVADEDGVVKFENLQPGEFDLVVVQYENEFYEECFSTPYAKVTVADHDWEWEITKKPTLEEDGLKERTCSICEKHEEEVIPKLQETIVDVRLNAEAGEPAKMYEDLYVRSDTAYNAGFEKFDDMSTITMADAVVAAHIREYGVAFKGDTTGEVPDAQMVVQDSYGYPWTTKIFNSTKSNSVWLNNEFAMSGIFDVAVEDGDLVSVELYESTDWSDTYLYIDKDEYESDEDGYVDVKLTAMIMDEYYNYNPEPVEGATIVLTGNDNDSLFEAETDEDGVAHILADFAGSYTVSVKDVPYDNPWLPQTAEAVVSENAHTFKVARKNAIEEIRAYAEENKDKADPEEVEIAALKAENKIKDAETVEEIAAALEEGKSNIDALVQAAEDAVQALATAKQEAIDALDEIDLSEYDEDDQEEMEEIIESGKTAIENAQSVEQVDSIFDSVVSALDEYSTAAEKLDNEKAEALAELDEIDPEDYIESVREQVAQLIADAGTAIEAAQSSEDIDDIMSNLYEALDELETVEEVENIIADVEAALEEDFSPEDYIEADREKAAQLINAAKEAVANAKTIEEISGIMDDLVEQLKALTTTEEQDDALAKAKADAIAFLQNMIAEDSDKVLESDKVKLEVAALKAMFQVQNATDIDSVNNLVNEAIGTADKLINDKIIADETAAAKKLKVTKLKAKSKKRKFTVSWKKNTQADGYQVQYKLKSAKKFKSLKKSTTKVKVTSKKLKKGKKYIFRVRPYKTVNGKKVYGKWAKTKAVKCK